MKVFTWPDQRGTQTPRVVMQQGRCDDGHCRQFSISISNGSIGLTVRFDDEAEFRRFWADGDASLDHAPPVVTLNVARERDV